MQEKHLKFSQIADLYLLPSYIVQPEFVKLEFFSCCVKNLSGEQRLLTECPKVDNSGIRCGGVTK